MLINFDFSKDDLRVSVNPDDLNFRERVAAKVQKENIKGEVEL